MSDNDYYKRTKEFDPRTRANGLDVEFELDAISAAFDKIPEPREDGQGYDGPIHVGAATAPTHAVQLQQMEAQLGDNTENANRAEEAAERAEEARDIAIEKARQSGEARDEALEAAATVTNIHREQLEKALGVNARVYPRLTNQNLKVGDVIPAPEDTADGLPITHVIVDGNAYAMSPLASGVVTSLTETSATIGGVGVALISRPKFAISGLEVSPGDKVTSGNRIYTIPKKLPDLSDAPATMTLDGSIVNGHTTVNGGTPIICFSVFYGFEGSDLVCIVEANGYDGTNADTIANLAYEQGYGVMLPTSPVYVGGSGVRFTSKSVTIGFGDKISGFVAMPSFRGNIFETKGFNDLVTSDVFLEADGCPVGNVIKDFFILGNKDSYPDADITAVTGYGMRYYGKSPTISNIRISHIPNVGLHTALGKTGVDPLYDPFKDNIEGSIENVYIFDTGYENFIFDGPRDIYMDGIYCGWAADSLRNKTFDPAKTSKFFAGARIDGVVMRRGAEIGFLHQFDNVQGWGFNYRGDSALFTRLTATKLFAERNFGNLRFGPNTKYVLTTVISEENMYGDGSRPHISDESDKGLTCSDCQIQRSQDTSGSCIEVKGFRAKWKGKIICNGPLAGHGVVLSGQSYDVEFETEFNQGTTFSGEESSGLVMRPTADRGRVKVTSTNCDVAADFQGSTGKDYRSFGTISSAGCTTPFKGVDKLSYSQYKRFDLYDDQTGQSIRANAFLGSGLFDYGNTALQTIVIPHTLVRFPKDEEITCSLVYVSGTIAPVEIPPTIVNTSDTQITVQLKLGSGGSGQGRVVVRF
ncbi:hypothetical protein [Vibrio cholerae]|uniref:hypothetical protein n=1 Tax=Vibrio cholerae TaxID=666 RepID=UPI00307FF049